MQIKVVDKRDTNSLIEYLGAEREVIGAKPKEGKFVFGVIEEPGELQLEYPATILPPKKYFLPPRETLLRFKRGQPASALPAVDSTPRAIVGMHACDIHATWLLDTVFSHNNADTNYLAARDKALIVGISCKQPCDEYSFCKSMGTLNVDKGYDLFLTDIGDAYAVKVGSAKGADILQDWGRARDATYRERNLLKKVEKEQEANFPNPLHFDVQELPGLLGISLDSLLWEVLGQKCLACGSCNLVCPTCYCFDVFDEVQLNLQDGERVRQWDSCQLETFAKVATGENFREKRSDRQRHRFYRKGKYLKEKYGEFACVGCGRCARACLVAINPVEVYNQLRGG